MTVLQLISSEGFYGAENMLVALASSLRRLDCDVAVGVFYDRRDPHTEVAEAATRAGIRAVTIACNGRFDLGAVRRLRGLLRDIRVDVLHAHGYKADLYGYAATLGHRIALVSTCHNWPSRRLIMRAYACADRLILRRFDRVATPSPVVADILRRSGTRSDRLAWINNGIDTARFGGAEAALRRELGAGQRPVIGFVGRLVEDKGGSVLIEAAQQVLAKYPQALFVFVGEGQSRAAWEALASGLGIERSVIFCGARTDMAEVYASFDMLVLPSFNEAMPMCVLEAMAAGKPVVATRVGAVSEVVVVGKTGWLIEPRDATGLAAGILHYLDAPVLAAEAGAAARTHIVQRFSSDAMARRYVELYGEALDRPSLFRRVARTCS